MQIFYCTQNTHTNHIPNGMLNLDEDDPLQNLLHGKGKGNSDMLYWHLGIFC